MSLSTLRPPKKNSGGQRHPTPSSYLHFEVEGLCSHCDAHAHPPSNPYLNPHPNSNSHPNIHPNPYPSPLHNHSTHSSASRCLSSSNSTRRLSGQRSRQSLRRTIRGNPEYSMSMLEVYGIDELRRLHYMLQLHMMEKHPENWYDEAFPAPMRFLVKESFPEVVKYAFTDRAAFYKTMHKHINEFKDGKTDVQLILFKPFPLSMIASDVVWDFNLAPHCRFTYLEAQKTVIMKVAKETRFIESLPRNQLKYDDSDHGVQGHALGRIKYGLKKHLSIMGVSEDEYDFLYNAKCKSAGIRPVTEDPAEFASIHGCDRMFIPHRDGPKVDAQGSVWPTMVVETGLAQSNAAGRKYLEFCVDWWLTQSEGVTQIVLLMYFDYDKRETIVEKWVRVAEPPFNKSLAQTIVINIQPNEDLKKQVVVVGDEKLTLSLESLMGRPKREGETDIIFEKGILTGFANGYLLPWSNLGPDRKSVVLGSDITGSKAKSYSATTGTSSRDSSDTFTTVSQGMLQAALGPTLSRRLAVDISRNLGTNGTPQYELSGTTIRVTLNRTNKPFDKNDTPPNATGEQGIDIDKEENKKVQMELTLEEMIARLRTQED